MSIANSLADRYVTRIGGAMSIAVSGVGPPSLQPTGFQKAIPENRFCKSN